MHKNCKLLEVRPENDDASDSDSLARESTNSFGVDCPSDEVGCTQCPPACDAPLEAHTSELPSGKDRWRT